MHPPPEPPTAPPTDQQDLVNMLLASAVEAAAALSKAHRAVELTADEPQTAADLADTASALTRIRDAMLRAADEITASNDADAPYR